MLCTHFLMTEFVDMGSTAEAQKLPRIGHLHTNSAHTAHIAVVQLPGAECEASLVSRCKRHLRQLNLQTMFYNV